VGILDRAREQARAAGEQARAAAQQFSALSDSVTADDDERLGEPADEHDFRQADPGDGCVTDVEPGEGTSAAGAGARDTANDHPAVDPRELAHLGLSKARAGLAGVVERIDPGILADVVIKATSLQESANVALCHKGSPYRISGISITATIPPQVSFGISRVSVDEN
jgi:hypothetical protein